MAGLPQKVQLHQKYSGQGLVVVALSVEGEDSQSEVDSMIEELKMEGLENLLLKEGLTEAANEAIECDGVIPAMNLYDRQGSLRHKITDELDHEQLEAMIEELLLEQPSELR